MNKIFLFIFSILISVSSLAQKGFVSIQGGGAFPISKDLKDFSKTMGYCYGLDGKYNLANFAGSAYGLIVDTKTSTFLLQPEKLYPLYLENNNNGKKSYQETSFGIGLSISREIGRSGFFYDVNIECLGIFDFEPNFNWFSYMADGVTEIGGSMYNDNVFTIGYNFGIKLYKMITKNLGVGIQVDWLECAPNVTTYVTTNNPISLNTVTSKCNYQYITSQMKIIRAF
ncbi:MAG: hypothetical protein MJ204_08105 [Bacteroidales bacterium]|nr:hypothetical protein [Bacteroidales bacterium]